MTEIQYADSALFLTDTDIQHVIIVASSHLICRQNYREYLVGQGNIPSMSRLFESIRDNLPLVHSV